jgi:hypothetical protein
MNPLHISSTQSKRDGVSGCLFGARRRGGLKDCEVCCSPPHLCECIAGGSASAALHAARLTTRPATPASKLRHPVDPDLV